jgi:uncharacterized protein YndB with AHSA1/START domain
MLDGSEYESSGERLEVVKPERLSMSWRWTGGAEDPGESLVDFAPLPRGTNSHSHTRACTMRRVAAATRKAGPERSTS